MTYRPTSFFRSTAKPTVDEFFRDVLDIRRGRLAAIVLFHMADYWNQEHCGNPDDSTLRTLCRQLVHDCPDFRLIMDIANASKHDRLTRNDAARQLSTSQQVSRSQGIFGAPFGTAAFNEASIVMVTRDDGQSRPLAGVIRSVFDMWEAKLR